MFCHVQKLFPAYFKKPYQNQADPFCTGSVIVSPHIRAWIFSSVQTLTERGENAISPSMREENVDRYKHDG